jgi:two-component system, sensor histidine kinase and response regulator
MALMEHPLLQPEALVRLHRLGGNRLVGEMIALFLTHGPEKVAALQAGAAAGNAPQVERAAHSLRSSAGNLGARRLQQTAATLETAAAEGVVDVDLAERLVREFEASAAALRAAREELGT